MSTLTTHAAVPKHIRRALKSLDKNVQRSSSTDRKNYSGKLVESCVATSKRSPRTPTNATNNATEPTQKSQTRRQSHTPKSRSLPSLPSVEDLDVDGGDAFLAASTSSTTSLALSSFSSDGDFEEATLWAPSDSEEFRYVESLPPRPITPVPTYHLPVRQRRRSFDDNTTRSVIYSTQHPDSYPFNEEEYGNEEARLGLDLDLEDDDDYSPFGLDITPVPSSTQSREETWRVLDFEEELYHAEEIHHARHQVICASDQWAQTIPAPAFHPEPFQTFENMSYDDGDMEPAVIVSVRRKPVPTAPRTMAQLSHDLVLSRILSSRPFTTSLLSFTNDMLPWQKLRLHRDRVPRGRPQPEEHYMRKDILKNFHLRHRAPVSNPLDMGSPIPTYMAKPFLFPRCGDLHRLHATDSTSIYSDWKMGWLPLSTLHKQLYSFDMGVRCGYWDEAGLGEMDMNEEAEECLAARHWEVDWDTRFKVAEYLMRDLFPPMA